MHRKRNILFVSFFIIALVGSVALSMAFSSEELSYVVDSYANGEEAYLIDDDGEELHIIQMDLKGNTIASIEVDKTDEGVLSGFQYLTMDEKQLYVYKIDWDILSNQVLSEAVYVCDFDKRKIKKAWELPVLDAEAQNNFGITVRNSQLNYFTVEYNDQTFMAQAVLHSMKRNHSKPSEVARVNYDIGIGFTEFFYADNGDILFTTPKGDVYSAAKMNEEPLEEPRLQEAVETISEDMQAEEPMAKEKAEEEPLIDVQVIAQNQLDEPKSTEIKKAKVREYNAVLIYPSSMEDKDARLVNFASDGKHTIYYMDLDKTGYFAMDLTTGNEEAVLSKWTDVQADIEIAPYDLTNIGFTDKNNFTATISLNRDKGILGIYKDGIITTYEKTQRTNTELVLKGILYFLEFIALFLVIFLLRWLFLLFTKGKFPIVAKVIAVCLPVVIISLLVLQNLINSIFIEQITNSQYKELYLISKQQAESISSQLLGEIDLNDPYNNVYYYELRSLLTALPSNSTVFEEGTGKKGFNVYDFGYHWLYKVEDERLVSVYCDQNYIDVPIEYYYDKDTAQMFYDAVETKQTFKGSFRDIGGEWICLAIPILDENGDVVAVMETGTTKASLEYAVKQNTKQINIVNLTILIVLIVLLTILLLVSLAPLKALKNSIMDIIHGKLGVQTRIHGNDEIAEISEVFNQMSTSIEFHVNELTKLNEGYYKFVPAKMFSLLRKSSVIDVRLGDQMNSDITILSTNAVGFENMISSMNSHQMFTFINDVYSKLVPIVTGRNGVVDKFEEAGLLAFYTKSSEEAIITAVSVCQAMELVNLKRSGSGQREIQMANGISFGPVMVGIVGHKQRLAATTVSEHTNLSGYLRKLAPKYCSKILTTYSTISQIDNLDEKFNTRFIGFLHVTASDSTEKLYDVFDGDNEQIKLLKKQTKDLFEKGVNLYCEKDYYEARLVFVEVLKKFRQDLAAKEYLYRCDMYYQRENKDDISVFVEEY